MQVSALASGPFPKLAPQGRKFLPCVQAAVSGHVDRGRSWLCQAQVRKLTFSCPVAAAWTVVAA